MKIIGHRGARGLAPENTIAALQKGLDHGVDGLEFDLRVTKDSVVVLHHGPDLTDQSGSKLNIADHTFEELLKHKKDLPTFEDVLERFENKTFLYVEVKRGEPVKPIAKIIREHLSAGLSTKNIRLASFSQSTLLEFHNALPEIELIVIDSWSGLRAVRRARELGTNHIVMNQRWLWSGFIRAMTRRGYKIGAYTVNNPRQAKRWARAGLRVVVTDYPDRFQSH
jgi:glycerophosphoryl diester phosphodiesterase